LRALRTRDATALATISSQVATTRTVTLTGRRDATVTVTREPLTEFQTVRRGTAARVATADVARVVHVGTVPEGESIVGRAAIASTCRPAITNAIPTVRLATRRANWPDRGRVSFSIAVASTAARPI
jgi:hypothetical protein